MIQSRRGRDLLTKISAQTDDTDSLVSVPKPLHDSQRVVGAIEEAGTQRDHVVELRASAIATGRDRQATGPHHTAGTRRRPTDRTG